MRTVPALAFLLLAAPGLLRAAEIRQYTTRLDLDPDGTGHATSTLVLSGDPSERVVIPIAHGAWTNFLLAEATDGLRLEPPGEKATTFEVTLPPASAAASRLSYTFDVPAVFVRADDATPGARRTLPRESRTVRYAFVNSQVTPIRDFGVLVTLPRDYRFHAIREQLPRQTKSEVEPRVRLGADGGRQNALLRLTNLRQGDDTSMQLEALPSQRSYLWLVAGVVLSALYLHRFRDLVARRDG